MTFAHVWEYLRQAAPLVWAGSMGPWWDGCSLP